MRETKFGLEVVKLHFDQENNVVNCLVNNEPDFSILAAAYEILGKHLEGLFEDLNNGKDLKKIGISMLVLEE